MIEEKTITIKVKGSELRNINTLKSFQGEGEKELKVLTEENYKKLRREIIDLGFCEPLCVWGENILNGHQRVKTLKRMRDEEGYIIPNIPVNVVVAKNYKEAKKMVLSLTSQFGKMTEESLLGFIKDADLELNEVMDSFNFAELDMDILGNLGDANFNETDFGEAPIEPISDDELSDMVRNSDVDFLDKIRNEVRRFSSLVNNDIVNSHVKSMVQRIILEKIGEITDECVIGEYQKQ